MASEVLKLVLDETPVYIYTFIACFSFCFIFKFHKKAHILAASIGAALSWVVFVACKPLGNDLAQYLISTIVVSAFSEVMARIFKAPVTGFLTISVIPLVPGGGIYYTMEHCVLGETQLFIETAIHTIAIAGAIAIGVLMVSSIVRLFHMMNMTLKSYWREKKKKITPKKA